jgi:putative spermidine/putrescine transport system ATP-binding protein
VTASPAVELVGVSRTFGTTRAVDDVSLTVAAGEFFSMLGPSGSGKTTCLRLIAGFERPDRGTIVLLGQDATALPPFQRNVNTVFQDYALFPHMSVRDNVAYGPMVRGVDRATRVRDAEKMLDTVGLGGLGARKPAALSGGQRQRVALARALINEPRVLLLDEPLGALDLKLREQMQTELKALQRRLGITFIYVTHDQGEALSMSDRVAVFHQGKVEQLDTPEKLYQQPATTFVADFVGGANVVRGELARRVGGGDGPYALRPERIRIGGEAGGVTLRGRVVDVSYHGATSRYAVALPEGVVVQVTGGPAAAAVNDEVALSFPREALVSVAERG